MAKTAINLLNGGLIGSSSLTQKGKTAVDFLPSKITPTSNVQTSGITAVNTSSSEENKNKKKGFFNGLLYAFEKLNVGTTQAVEGIVDYLGAGFAKLIGADDWAERQISNDWFGDWYSHPDEWYDANDGWKFVGDVAGGIGSSAPAVGAAIVATVYSGGTAAPAAASFLTAGFSAAGSATKEAYQETGELTGKEFGYGAMAGLLEGGIETASNFIGAGTGQIIKSIGKSVGKEVGQEIGESLLKQGVKTLGKSFIGEAMEEGVTEYLTPYLKRVTYDPNAKGATAEEVIYAGLVGGFSGVIMGGSTFTGTTVQNITKGNKLSKGDYSQILDSAEDLSEFGKKNGIDTELFKGLTEANDRLKKSLGLTGGQITTLQQRNDLGALYRAEVGASMSILVAKRAINIVNNADVIAERLNSYQYKDANGKAITFSAEQLTKGFDASKPQSIYKALETNEELRSLAIADATGRVLIDAGAFRESALMGKAIASQVDLNRFLETASPKEIAAVSKALGIDSWSGLTADMFNQKVIDFVQKGGYKSTVEAMETKKKLSSISEESAKPVPKVINLVDNSMKRYTDGNIDIAIERVGDSYSVYDFATDELSNKLTRSDVNSLLREYGKSVEAGVQSADSGIKSISPETNALLEEIKKFQDETRGVDDYARTNIKDYNKLSEPTKGMIRKVIREGRANGINEEDLLMLARVSAHSGIDIAFDKEANAIINEKLGMRNDTSSRKYADGFYDASKNRIVINPEAKRTGEALIIHELDHAIRKYFDSEGKPATRIYLDAIEGVDRATRDKITKAYKKTAKPGEAAATIMDETNAYYAEQVLGNRYTLEKLLEAEPTLKEKILSFFKGASEDYADVPKLSGAAKRYYRTYKKLFDEFSARNAENNANEKTLTSMNQENMQVSDRQYAVKEQRKFTEYNKPITTADTDSIHSIAAQKRKLGQSLSVNAFVKEDIEVTQKWAHKFYQELGVKSPFFRAWYGDWRAHDKSQRKIVSVPTIDISDVVLSTGDYKIDDTGWTVYAGKTLNDDTRHHTGGNKINVKSLSTINEILNNAILLDTVASEPDTNKKSPNTAFLHKLYTLIEYEGQTYIAKTTVEEFYNQGKNGVSRKAYNLKAIKIESAGGQFRIKNSSSSVPVTDSVYSIADLYEFVKSYDKDFTPAPEISPLLLNKDGTPKVFYHGTNAEFRQFDLSKSGSNFGNVAEGMFFFTDKKQAYPNSAKDYAREAVKTKGGSEQIYEVYIAMKKPLVIDSRFSYDPVSYYDANQERIYEQYFEGDYDGIIVRDSTGKSSTSTLVMVDNPSQIKSATDNIGTFSPYEKDIQYALPIDEDGISGAEVLEKSRKTNREHGRQYSMDIDSFYANGEEFATPTINTVGKERMTYNEKAFSKDWLFTKKTSAYIHAVDEMYGIQTYLEKIGKMKSAKAVIQNVRSAPHQAQSMIGSVQYNVFEADKKKAKKLGDGLGEIFRPIERQGEKVREAFNDYLLHHLNVDKYNAYDKMKKMETDAVESLHKVQEEIAEQENKKAEHEKRIFELGDTATEKKLKEGNRKAIERIDAELEKLKADEREIMLQMPMHAEEELTRVNGVITALTREKGRLNHEIFELGNDEASMNKKRELREEIRKIEKEIESERENADRLGEILRMHDYALKPVFNVDGGTITKEESESYISKYDSQHPEFKETAEKVWNFSRNLNDMRVSSGLISKSFKQRMAAMYPHYVPAFRSKIENRASGDEGVSVSSTVKRAKGYNQGIMDVKESIASQVSQVMRNGNVNILANKVFDTASKTGDAKYVDIGIPEADSAEIKAEGKDRPKPHTISFFKNGIPYQMNVSEEMYLGFKGIGEASAPHTNVWARAANWITDKYKKLVTSYSPAFMIRNAIRDMQDAGLNSKHPMLFAKNVSRAWVELVKNSENWQTYRAYGGFSSTVFDSKGVKGEVGTKGFELLGMSERLTKGGKLSIKDVKYLKSLFKGIENLNAAVEQIPRFAEYLASLDAGETIEQAVYNSAEVTTNFGRRGATTKQLNSTIIPFLNPAIQGFDKIFRNFSDAINAGSGKDVTRALGVLFGKAIAIGMLPALFNSLLYDDDEDYEDLREEDKENNYLFKLPNGTFLKLPRGRVVSVIAGLTNRTIKTAKGEDADWGGYAENVVSQITPVENLTRTVFSPFMDVANNLTWYGTEIEGRQFENVRPEDRYDESTSSIAIALGKAFKYSPKKIHYLIDQYSGVIGDFLLPATTQKAEKDFFSGNFTIDSVTNNKISNQFYKVYDDAQYAKTDGSVKAQYQVKYLNRVKSATSELYNEINAIQNSDLSSVEKLKQTRVLRALINEAMKNAISDYDKIGQAIDATANMGFDDANTGQANIRYAEIIRRVYGAERAFSEYNDTVYSDMTVLHGAGLSYDTLYDYYFSTKGLTSDKDEDGKTVSGSKRAKVVQAISSLGVSTEERLLLVCASGYSLKDGDVKGLTAEEAKTRLLKYILNLKGVSAVEKAEIAEMCGFEVKNGKIVTSSAGISTKKSALPKLKLKK